MQPTSQVLKRCLIEVCRWLIQDDDRPIRKKCSRESKFAELTGAQGHPTVTQQGVEPHGEFVDDAIKSRDAARGNKVLLNN
jgi:hypothetical protein